MPVPSFIDTDIDSTCPHIGVAPYTVPRMIEEGSAKDSRSRGFTEEHGSNESDIWDAHGSKSGLVA